MQQIKNYEAAQEFIDKLTGTASDERHAQQREYRDGENRAQRRERERQERRAAKRTAKVKA